MSAATQPTLPDAFRPYFWDVDFAALRWSDHHDFIVGRVLAVGSWQAIRELRDRLDDRSLHDWLLRREGDHLTPPQLRLWQLLLDLPAERVDAWVAARRREPWFQRGSPSS